MPLTTASLPKCSKLLSMLKYMMSQIFRCPCLSRSAQRAEASEESGEFVADDANDSPANAQGFRSVEPPAGESVGNPADVVAVTAPQFGPKRMREAGMSPEAVMRVCSERAKKRAGVLKAS